MLGHGTVVGLTAVLLAGCCGATAQSGDAMRRRQYELDQREARLKLAESRFRKCVATNFPGVADGLDPPAAAQPQDNDVGEETLPETSAGEGGGLSAEQHEEVKRVERIGQRAVVSCYEEEVERSGRKDLQGKVVVKILIGTAGSARQVTIGQSAINAPAFKSCLIQAIRGWEFPRLSHDTRYSTTFSFSPAY